MTVKLDDTIVETEGAPVSSRRLKKPHNSYRNCMVEGMIVFEHVRVDQLRGRRVVTFRFPTPRNERRQFVNLDSNGNLDLSSLWAVDSEI